MTALRAPLVALLAATLLLDAAPAAGRKLNAGLAEQYLNHNYIGDNWDGYADYMANGILHAVDTSIRKKSELIPNLGLCWVGSSEVDVKKRPWFTATDSQLLIRIPDMGFSPPDVRPNYDSIHLTVSCGYSVDMWMYFAVTGVITAKKPVFSVDFLEVEVADLLLGLIDITGWISDLIKESASGNLDDNLAAFSQMKWDPTLTLPDATVGWVAGADPDLPRDSVIDILLVADGYTTATLRDYQATVDTIAVELLTPSDPEVTAPFGNFASAIRLWSLPRTIPTSEANDSNSLYRMLTGYEDGGSWKTTFNNVAMVSLLPTAFDATVVIADGRELGSNDVRANAVGRFISLPSYARADPVGGSADDRARAAKSRRKTANVMIHELGHTRLGDLTDEYQRKNETYRGKEPLAVNASTHENSAKWQHHPDRDPKRGAYNYKRGIYRPYPSCRMDKSWEATEGTRQNAFCPVCREALTRGFNRHLTYPFLVPYYEALWPYADRGREEPIGATTNDMGYVGDLLTVTGTPYPTRTLLAIRGVALPTPWAVRWNITRASGVPADVVEGNEVLVDLYPGDTVDLSVGSTNDFIRDPAFTGYEPVTGQLGTQSHVTFPEGPPAPPEKLFVDPADNPIANFYDPETGLATSQLKLGARPGCYSKFVMKCSIEWNVIGESGANYTFMTEPTAPDDEQAIMYMPGYLPEGSYTARARSSYKASEQEVLTSDWVTLDGSFTMGPLGLTSEPHAPHDPVALRSEGCDDSALLAATTWDVNGDAFRVEFEVRPAGIAFLGDADPTAIHSTPMISGEPDLSSSPPSIRFEGQVRHRSADAGPYDWQARAVDDSGQPGAWVRGPSFFLGPFSSCNIERARRRLADHLASDSELREHFLDGAWTFEPGRANPHPVPCVGSACEPFAIVAGHLADRLKDRSPVSMIDALPAAIRAGLTGAARDAKPPLPTVLRHAWKQALTKDLAAGKDLFTTSAAAGVPAIIFAETSHLYTDLKTGVARATVTLHAVDIKRDKIATTVALGTAKLEEVAQKSAYLAAKTEPYSAAEQQAITDGAYRAALQLAARATGEPPPTTVVPAANERKGMSCLCSTDAGPGDAASTALLLGLIGLALLCERRRRRRRGGPGAGRAQHLR